MIRKLLFAASCLAFLQLPLSGEAAEPIDVGSRLELFVDDYLVDKLDGDAKQVTQRPQPQEVVLTTDKPWEGNTSAYYTVFRDGDLFRMYYRGSHYDTKARKAAHPEVTCYAESKDGIHWTKPELGLFEFNGSKKNNIVWDGLGTHCFAVFKDSNPNCSPDAKYKAISRGRPVGKKGLYVFQSPDGIHWKLIQPEPVITRGAFDSQNLAFWDAHAGIYREYHRTFTNGVRAIMTGTSKDFLHWSKPTLVKHPGTPPQHLYTNAIQPYARAPHILIGFPTRYLPKEGSRVEPTFMSSRDGVTFPRRLDPVIPEDAPEDRDGNRSNYMAWGVVQLPDNDRELSVYATEAYYTGPDSRVRRFTYRVDGFVSVGAPTGTGSLLTKPIRFDGEKLVVNLLTQKGGSLRIGLTDQSGKPIAGFAAADCKPLSGDSIEQTVAWKNGSDVSQLAGKAVRLRIEFDQGELFSFVFRK